MNNKNITDSLQQVIVDLSISFAEQTQNRHEASINKLRESFNQNEHDYLATINMANYEFESFAALPFIEKYKITEPKHKAILGFIYSGLLEHYLQKVIVQAESSSCSADKTNFIIGKVMKSCIENQNFSLFETYAGHTQIDKSKWNNQAFWSPKSFKDTAEVIERFFNWYNVIDEDE